ncbi:MAG: divergent polysaccharide deacetylase family protein [Rhodobacteraceae bacterium]|nr:divergent polysaccharide deacetylase family protein [Paracoccaceae bacterium]
MGRGLLSGIIWGAIVGAFIVVLASQMAVQQDLTLPRPNATPVEVPVGTEFNQARPERDPVVPGTDETPTGDEVADRALSPATQVDSPPEAETELGLAPVEPAETPEAGNAPEATQAPEVVVVEDAAVPSQTEAEAPQLPVPETPGAKPGTAPAAPAPSAPEIAGNVTDAGTSPEIASGDVRTSPERVAPGGLASLAPEVAPEAPVAVPSPDTDTASAPTDTPAAQPIGVPVPPAEDLAPSVRTNELPQIGGAPTVEDDGAVEVADTSEEAIEPIATPGEGALRAFRRGFENPGDQPLLSVILVHDETTDLQTLNGLPFPVSIAVDVARPNAAEIAAQVRADGGEVLMIPALPDGGTPSDIEVALQSNIALIPEAIALMDLPGASFQGNRAAVQQIVEAVTASGHALVTFPRGLNTAQKLAERDGVPTGLIFRDLEGAGQTNADMRRTLDQAAFRARQQSSVILVGRATPDTVAALTEWALGNRAATVAIAPVSAAILINDTAG